MAGQLRPGAPADGRRYRRYTRDERRAMLVEAGLACLAEGGIGAFTIDRICAAAGASRGLVTHHFGSKDGLLAAVYETMYDRMLGAAAPTKGGSEVPDLAAMVEAVLADDLIDRASLNAWLALWGEVANTPALRDAHRRYYDHYLSRLSAAIGAEAARRGRTVDTDAVATIFIALIDGLWLERCLDPARIPRDMARRRCLEVLEAFIGPPLAPR